MSTPVRVDVAELAMQMCCPRRPVAIALWLVVRWPASRALSTLGYRYSQAKSCECWAESPLQEHQGSASRPARLGYLPDCRLYGTSDNCRHKYLAHQQCARRSSATSSRSALQPYRMRRVVHRNRLRATQWSLGRLSALDCHCANNRICPSRPHQVERRCRWMNRRHYCTGLRIRCITYVNRPRSKLHSISCLLCLVVEDRDGCTTSRQCSQRLTRELDVDPQSNRLRSRCHMPCGSCCRRFRTSFGSRAFVGSSSSQAAVRSAIQHHRGLGRFEES